MGPFAVLALTPAVAFAASRQAASPPASKQKTVTLRKIGNCFSGYEHTYNVTTKVPGRVRKVKTVVRYPATPGAAIILDHVGVAAAVDSKSRSARSFLRTTRPKLTNVRNLGNDVWAGEDHEMEPIGPADVYAVKLSKRLVFSLTLPGLAATEDAKLARIMKEIVGRARYAGEQKPDSQPSC